MSVIVRIFGIVLTTALSAATIGGLLMPAPNPSPIEVPVSAAQMTPLPATNTTAGPSLIERSPFTPGRRPFSRDPDPPAPEVEVRLAGIFKVGKELRASLVVGAQTIVVSIGDETPIGSVSAIEPTAVTLEGASPRRIELFKQ